MKPNAYVERTVEVDGWKVTLTSFRMGGIFYCKADNVSPGAWLARTTASTREEAEAHALERARELLSRTRRQPV